MNKLQIPKENVLTAYENGNESEKKFLANLFGENVFSDPMARIRTYEDACKALGYSPVLDKIDTGIYPDEDMTALVAHGKLLIITRALNGGWKPNWEDEDEYKWYPWFNMKGGFGFSDSGYTYAFTRTGVGSRLCFKSEELANYAGKQFESIYKDLLTF